MIVEIKGMTQWLARLDQAGKQGRYAFVQALNRTALDIQAETLEKTLPEAFTLRASGTPWQKPGTKYGFNVRPFATKDNPQAIIGSQADWLKLQEHGGTKKGDGHRVAVPTTWWKGKLEVLNKHKRPRNVLRANRTIARIEGRGFIPKEGGRLPREGIWARTTKKRLPIKRLYTFKDSVAIPDILDFRERGRELAERRFSVNFAAAFAKAMATAK